jgi:hypothetical protein
VGQAGVYVGRKHIERALQAAAPKGLRAGQLNDHLEFESVIDVDGPRAKGRIFELAFVGGGGEPAKLVQNVHENEYVQRSGMWMIQSMHSYTILVTDYDQGWAKSALPAPAVSAALPPDRAPTVVYEAYPKVYTPPLHFSDVSAVEPPRHDAKVSMSSARIAAAARQVRQAMDFDEIENLQNAYGYYAEKSLWSDIAALFADDGVLEIDDVRHAGREGVLAFLKQSGPEGPVKGVLNSLLQLQPVIDIGADGRTAKIRSRVLQLTRDAQGKPIWGGGVYENELVKVNGTWKFRSLHLYRTYKVYYKGGWATPGNGELMPSRFTPPFHYRNPVSGRP